MKWKFRWLLAVLPLAVGIAASVLFSTGIWPNPIAYVRANLSVLALLFGITASIVVATAFTIQEWGIWVHNQAQSQAADDRRRFLRRLDHELKNPLTAIRAGLANLVEAPSQDLQAEALDSVQAQALRLSRLSADLRKLAELETRPLELAAVNLGDLLEDAFALAQDRQDANERNLALTIPRAPWPLPAVSGDHDLLFLAVHNLIDNALKFSRSGDTVEIRAFEDGATVVLEVADTGPGIPEDEIAHVWEELYRGQQARGVPGSGLGLALVRAIAERHGGRVTLRSRTGQGTVFTIRLPVS